MAYRIKEEKEEAVNDMKELGAAYVAYQSKEGRAPLSVDELQPLLDGKAATLQKRAREDLDLLWGAPMGTAIPGAEKRLFALFKKNAGSKRVVLFQNGDVGLFTEEEVSRFDKIKPEIDMVLSDPAVRSSMAELEKCGAVYQQYQSKEGKAPESISDLKSYLSIQPTAVQKCFRDDVVVFRWGRPMGGKIPGAEKQVFAYRKKPVSGQIIALLRDGNATPFSEKAFEAVKTNASAGDKSSDPSKGATKEMP